MAVAVRPALARYRDRPLGTGDLAVVVAALLASAFATAAIGVHEIFGAFLLGAVFPRGRLAEELRGRLQSMVVVLLPVFFVATGLYVDIGGIGLRGLWELLLVMVVACAGSCWAPGWAPGARVSPCARRPPSECS